MGLAYRLAYSWLIWLMHFAKELRLPKLCVTNSARFDFATRFEFVTHRQRDDQRRNDTTRAGCDLTVPKHTVRKTGTELKQEPDGTEVDSASPNSLHLLVGHGRQSPTAVGFPYLI